MSTVAWFLHRLLLLQQPFDVVLFHNEQTSVDILQTVTRTVATSEPHMTMQILDVWQPHLVRQMRTVDAKKERLIIVLLGESKQETRKRSKYFNNMHRSGRNGLVSYYYENAHLMLVHWPDNATIDDAIESYGSGFHDIMLPEPYGKAIVAGYYFNDQQPVDEQNLLHVHLATRDLRTWLPPETFLQDLTANSINKSQPHRIQPVPIDSIVFSDLTIDQSSTPVDRHFKDVVWSSVDRELVRLTTAHFNASCSFVELPSAEFWTDQKEHGSCILPESVVPGSWTAFVYRSHLSDNMSSVWGMRRFSVIVPNWWHLRKDSDSMGMSKHQRISVCLLAASVWLFVEMVVVRWLSVWWLSADSSASATLGWVFCDTWARVIAVSVHRGMEGRRSYGGRMLVALATVWGMLNGIALTGVLFELSVSTTWQPVFGELADVWRHAWMPVYFYQESTEISVLSEVRLPGGFGLDTSRVRQSVDWGHHFRNHKIAAFVIDDDYPRTSEILLQTLHAINGSAVYRIIRDPHLVITDTVLILPQFLRPRMEALASRNQKFGLLMRSAALALHYGRLNGGRAYRVDLQTMRHLKALMPNGLVLLCQLYVAFNCIAACILGLELCWGGR